MHYPLLSVSLGDAIMDGARNLRSAGIDRPFAEARLLMMQATGKSEASLIAHPEEPLPPGSWMTWRGYLARRLQREPLAYILGHREFWGVRFLVSSATLDPRPDSETLIEGALRHVDQQLQDRDAPLRILDLGTGTGCLLLSLLTELPAATGIGTDISTEALAVAKRNALYLGLTERVEFRCADWWGGRPETFDIILSNPPYIPRAELSRLQPEVRYHEPRLALDGGEDGLDAYRRLAGKLPQFLKPGGVAFIEFGAGQEEKVQEIFLTSLCCRRLLCDLSGRNRAIELFQARRQGGIFEADRNGVAKTGEDRL